jgi:hypothetical protein
MSGPIVIIAIAASLAAAAAPGIAPTDGTPRTACELFSAVEVARFLAVSAVKIDSLNWGGRSSYARGRAW